MADDPVEKQSPAVQPPAKPQGGATVSTGSTSANLLGGGSYGRVPAMDAGMTFAEVGSLGLRAWSGWVREEFLPELIGRQGAQKYREMSDNSPIIGAIIYAIKSTMRKVEWRVVPAGAEENKQTSPEAQEAADFVESCMHDMTHSWEDLVDENLSMLTYGYAPHEIVYKKRSGRDPGEDPDNPGEELPKSEYDDGRIGWRRMPIRGQDTVLKWFFNKNGQIKGLTQQPWIGPLLDIPIEKMLLFRPWMHKNNPEGRSILRTAYLSYYFVKRIQEQEAIVGERLGGIPVLSVPSYIFDAANSGDAKAQAALQSYKKIATNVRVDEQMGICIPSDVWTGPNGAASAAKQFEFQLVTPTGRPMGGFVFDATIQRYNTNILTSVMADFLTLGHQSRGTQSLAISKVDMFFQAIEGYLNSMASVYNTHALPRLWQLNGFNYDNMPKIIPDLAQRVDLDVLSNFVLRMAQSGMPLFPNEELQTYIMDAAGLPDVVDEEALQAAGLMTEQLQTEDLKDQATLERMQEAPVAQPVKPPGGAFGKGRNQFDKMLLGSIARRMIKLQGPKFGIHTHQHNRSKGNGLNGGGEGAIPFPPETIAGRTLEKYSDKQPRVPAGSPEGGQWVGASGTTVKALTDLGYTKTPFDTQGQTEFISSQPYGTKSEHYARLHETLTGLGFSRRPSVSPRWSRSDEHIVMLNRPRGGHYLSVRGGESNAAAHFVNYEIAKFNQHHEPAGSREGGRFAQGTVYTDDVFEAAKALAANRKVVLSQPRSVAVLLDHLGKVTKEMVETGKTPPNFNLCNVYLEGSNLFCAGTKGIPRPKMPQFKGGAGRRAFIQYLRDKGYGVSKGRERSDFLRATQDELNGAKVAGIAQRMREDPQKIPRTIVSSDNYILDGHHRWAAQVANDTIDGTLGDSTTRVHRVDIGITQLLAEAKLYGASTEAVNKLGLDPDSADYAEALSYELMDNMAKYSPNQLRQPKGESDGGQFAAGGKKTVGIHREGKKERYSTWGKFIARAKEVLGAKKASDLFYYLDVSRLLDPRQINPYKRKMETIREFISHYPEYGNRVQTLFDLLPEPIGSGAFKRFHEEDSLRDLTDQIHVDKFNPYHVEHGPEGGQFTSVGNGSETEKLLSLHGVIDVTHSPEDAVAGFLTRSGHYLDFTQTGSTHNKVARQAGTTLEQVMAEGTARIYSTSDFLGIDILNRPTEAQMRTLSGLARSRQFEQFTIEGSNIWPTTAEGRIVTPASIRSTIDQAYPVGKAFVRKDDGPHIDDLYLESLAKYSPEQPRVGVGDPAGGQWVGENIAETGKHLGETSVDMAHRLLPGGFDTSPNAPNTFNDLVKHWDDTHRMVVFSGASDKTIFENAQQNYAFRAWHDLTHLRLMAPFTPEGEARVAEAQISDLRKFYGDTPQTRHMAGAIRAEINGQVQYSLAHGGDFPVDQRAFDAAWLRNPDQAVQMVFKLAAKYHWGRLRDKAAGMQHHEFKPSDLAIKVSVELQAAHHRAHVVKLYNPDEPRDERGRWTFGAVSAEEFVAARDKSSRIGYLSPLKPGDLTGYKLFANSNRTVGVAVSPTGDIQNVFNNGGPKGAGTNAVKWAIANGGTTLDCYAGFLPMYYSKLGFGETGRVKFDPQYAPSGWNYAEQDSPDVVFMKLR